MFSLQLKIFLILSLALHAALIGLIAYTGPKKVDTQARLLKVGFITMHKDPGVGKGSSPEPPRRKAEQEPERKAEPKPEKKPVKKVVRKKPPEKAPEKKNVVTRVKKETPVETETETGSAVENGQRDELALSSALTDSGADEGSGLDSKGTGKGAETVGYPDYGINPKPEYPRIAKRYGYEGLVILNVYVLESGRVGRIELRKSSGYDVLDSSALNAVKGWVFVPGMRNGEPAPSWVVVPIRFDLTSG